MNPSPHRVAYHFLLASAATPSPSALKLLKVMAEGGGKTSMLNINLLTETLSVLGWTVQETTGSTRLTSSDQLEALLAKFLRETRGKAWGYSGVKDPKEFWYPTEDAAQDAMSVLLTHVTKVSATGPANPKRGELYVVNVEGPFNDSHDKGRWIVRTQFWWAGVPSWTFATGKGGEAEINLTMDDRGRLQDPTAMKLPAFWTWAYKNGLQEGAKAYLDKIGAVQFEVATRSENSRSIDNTGTCPVCFTNVKLTGGTIMRHGWVVRGQRGWAQYGNSWHSTACWGTRRLPFEISKQGTEDYLKMVIKPSAIRATGILANLRQHPPEKIDYMSTTGKPMTVERPEGFVLDTMAYPRASYGYVLTEEFKRITRDIASMDNMQRTLEAAIQGWTPKPLPGTR